MSSTGANTVLALQKKGSYRELSQGRTPLVDGKLETLQ